MKEDPAKSGSFLYNDSMNPSFLTATEQHILDYIHAHAADIEHMSIRQLASETSTSPAAIMRTAQKLGYAGFSDLKSDVLRQNEAKKYVHAEIDFTAPFHSDDTSADIISHMGNLYHASTDALLSVLRPSQIQSFAQYLLKAKHIYLIASGETAICCEEFAASLSKLSIFPILTNNSSSNPLLYTTAGPDDCALILSYRGDEKYLHEMQYLKEKHCRVLVITASAGTVSSHADASILLPDHENKENVFLTFYSQFAMTFTLNCIFTCMRMRHQAESS